MAFFRFCSALAFALAMVAKASSKMETMRCCSASGGMGTSTELTKEIFKFRTVEPAALELNCWKTKGDDNR